MSLVEFVDMGWSNRHTQGTLRIPKVASTSAVPNTLIPAHLNHQLDDKALFSGDEYDP